jgi:murein DD-endopeptidase MepM/ murein hydrolase activator NlpD
MRLRVLVWVTVPILAIGIIAGSFYSRLSVERNLAEQIKLAQAEATRIQAKVVLFTEAVVPHGRPFNGFLQGLGIDALTTKRLVNSIQPVFDLRHLRAGNQIAIGRSVLGELRAVRYRIDPDRLLWVEPRGNEFHAEIQTIPSRTETAGVAGTVQGSLFEGVTSAGEKPELAMRLAEIFGYDLDFYTDPRPGDTFRVVVEKKMLSSGEVVSYGRILAAEYNNDGRVFRAVLFRDYAGHDAYFTPDGKSLKKAFLHSPLKFAAPVTSHFSTHRFHPILKTFRPHLGTDYAAPVGTPVQTIGDGRVVFAGRKGGAGNLIQIEHANGYETYYMHLSRLLVHSGQHVAQGQKIGLVGMTGLATGPHLDFRIQHSGQFLNFEHVKLPFAEPISKRDRKEFSATRDHAFSLLPDPHAKVAGNTATPSPVSLPTVITR